jgi:predicted nucleotidyltransferase
MHIFDDGAETIMTIRGASAAGYAEEEATSGCPAPPMGAPASLVKNIEALAGIVGDLAVYHPLTVVLFGSLARYLEGCALSHAPQDIDLLVVGDDVPPAVENRDYGCPVEFVRFRDYPFRQIAKSLRYDSRPLALSKLYGNQLLHRQAHNVIAACLLLGDRYREFGIEQIEIEGREDPRDYATQRVLYGRHWWARICAYARKRRGPFRRFSDKVVQRYEFDAD